MPVRREGARLQVMAPEKIPPFASKARPQSIRAVAAMVIGGPTGTVSEPLPAQQKMRRHRAFLA